MPEEYWSQIYLKLTKDGVASEITAEIINFSQNPFYLQRDYSLLRRRTPGAMHCGQGYLRRISLRTTNIGINSSIKQSLLEKLASSREPEIGYRDEPSLNLL